jgi:hypothetical protein
MKKLKDDPIKRKLKDDPPSIPKIKDDPLKK